MPVRTNIAVFIALLVLLFATVGAAYLPLGDWHFPVAMTIAAAKAVLIVLFFMHVLYSHRLTMVVSVASFLWLAIMIALTLSDYLTRGVLQYPGEVRIAGRSRPPGSVLGRCMAAGILSDSVGEAKPDLSHRCQGRRSH